MTLGNGRCGPTDFYLTESVSSTNELKLQGYGGCRILQLIPRLGSTFAQSTSVVTLTDYIASWLSLSPTLSALYAHLGSRDGLRHRLLPSKNSKSVEAEQMKADH